jgi:hypothetical protein
MTDLKTHKKTSAKQQPQKSVNEALVCVLLRILHKMTSMRHFLFSLCLWPVMVFAGPAYLFMCDGCDTPVARLELQNYTPGTMLYRYHFVGLEVFPLSVTFSEYTPDITYGNDNNGILPGPYHFEVSGTHNDVGMYFSADVDGSWAFGFTADCPPIVIEGPNCIFNPHTNPGTGSWELEQTIPEPGTLFLFALAGLIAMGRKRGAH